MTDCFIIENGIVKPTPELLLIHPFKDMWEDDHNHALKEFSSIFFMCSAKKTNPYLGMREDMRMQKIKDTVIKDPEFVFSQWYEEATKLFVELQEQGSDTYSYYMSALSAAEVLKTFLNSLDLDERNFKSGLPIYKPKDITSALTDTQNVVNNLFSLREKIQQENFESKRVRRDREIGDYENPS